MQCINKNSIEYQSLKLRADIPEFILESICRGFLDRYNRFPYLDELPNVNSESAFKKLFKIRNNGGAKVDTILENTRQESIESSNATINNEYRDLEVKITQIDDEDAIVEVEHRPTDNNFDNLTEEDEILSKAPRDRDGNLLAPNGKKSNLTEQLYVQVRTKAFKRWFGDWENSNIYMPSFMPKRNWNIGLVINTPVAAANICDNTQIKVFNYIINKFGKPDKKGTYYVKPVIIWAKSPINNKQILHSTVAVRINGDIYLYDMPQSEYIKYISENNGIVVKEYTPRLIKYTPSNLKQFYRTSEELIHLNDDVIFDEDIVDLPLSQASKIVDENGEPLVVRHFTDEHFTNFDLKFFGKNDIGDLGRGFYFTANKTDNDYFTGYYGSVIINAFLNIRNPFITDTTEKSNLAHLYYNRDLKSRLNKSDEIRNKINSIKIQKSLTEHRLFGNEDEYKKFKNPDYIGTIIEKSQLEKFNDDIAKLEKELNELKEDYDVNKEYNTNVLNLKQYDGVISSNSLKEIVVKSPNQIKSATSNSGSFNKFSRNISDPEPNGYLVLTNALEKLGSLYGIHFNEITNSELNSELWRGIIPDAHITNAFIYNGLIYINTDNADLDAPIHEMFHLFIGSIRFTDPKLYSELVQLVEQFPNYRELIKEYPNRTRNDVNEEIFVTEVSKYLLNLPSNLSNLPENIRYELNYNIKRVLDTILMGLDSVKTIPELKLFNLSLKDIANMVNSTIMVNQFHGTLDVSLSEMHRKLNNTKSDLYKKNELIELCE